MILGYLDCSQRNISTIMQRDIINQYARNNAYNIDIFINNPDIKNIKDNINSKENTLKGKTKKQIAKAVGCTPETIFKYLRIHPEIKTQ